ncbi:IS4 family transposase domain protein [Rickettsiales endosymbiont of Paramecium tredecaurelia]|nr:IS4 family transposase domain protein [Candidatus Sarmatiella mevalonica]
MWEFLPHCGTCSTRLMKEFLQKFLTYFPDINIERLLADREFMHKDWLDFLKEN